MKFIMTIASYGGESLYTSDFTLEEVNRTSINQPILVPTLEDYHEVRGQLFLTGNDRKVICLVPPSIYFNAPDEPIPYMLKSTDYELVSSFKDGKYIYYFERK